MIKLISILFSVIWVVGCAEIKEKKIETVKINNDNSLNEKTTAYIQVKNKIAYFPEERDPFTGKYELYYQNGVKAFEIHYKQGLPSGIMTQWYDTGQKKIEVNYKGGKEEGEFIAWNKDGNKNTEINYNSGAYLLNIVNAKNLYNQKLYYEAFLMFEQLAKQNNLKAQFYLGYMYKHGQGVKKNLEQGDFWYQKVAKFIAHHKK